MCVDKIELQEVERAEVISIHHHPYTNYVKVVNIDGEIGWANKNAALYSHPIEVGSVLKVRLGYITYTDKRISKELAKKLFKK